MPSIGKKRNKAGTISFWLLAPLVLTLTACAGGDGTQAPVPTDPAASGQAIPPAGDQEGVTAPAAESPATQGSALESTGSSPQASPTAAEASSPTETAAPQAAPAATLPDPAGYGWVPIAGGLQSPVGMAHAGDGSGRLFILEQRGLIQIVKDGQLLPDAFLDLRDRVGSGGSEQGLLGLAFHPDYAGNGQFYVNYTDLNGDTVIARFAVSPDNPDAADPGSEQRLLFQEQPYPNHNGGVLAFGPDGFLYIGLGDGGSAGDPQGNGQNTDALLGKVLRVDVDGGDPYGIPPDNPFAGGGGRPEVWAYGLRNPWRFSFDRLTGDLYIGDVGQGAWEEVNVQPAGSPGGENYGWNILEGQECFRAADCDPVGTVLPAFVYSTHAEGSCAITGGHVYRGSLPAFAGVYLMGDYCSGRVWGLVRSADGTWQSAPLFETGVRISSFGEDEAGEVYLVGHAGDIYRLEAQP